MEKCLWCTTSLEVEGEEQIRVMLERYSTGRMSEAEISSLNEDLGCCMECVDSYHQAREKVPELHLRLWELEKARLLQVFGSALNQELEEDDDLFIVEDDQEQPVWRMSPPEFHNTLRFPLFEVLKFPYLLCSQKLSEVVVRALCQLQDMSQPLTVFEKYQGTYLLLVHPNEKVRRWAIDTAKAMKSVDRDIYYDLKDIFIPMLYVIDLGVPSDLPDLDPSCYAAGTVPRLPSHLYDAHNKKNYWLGICMLLTQLSAGAMDSLFMGPCNIPNCILNTMEGLKNGEGPSSDPFWPALHCFMVILDRLGSMIWCQVDPNVAFQTVTGSPSYVQEIHSIQKKTTKVVKKEPECDDNVVTCSQVVYGCYSIEKPSQAPSSSHSSGICNNMMYEDMQSLVKVLDSEMGQSMRVYGSTFLWFIPFVRSIMELPEINASYISEVVHFLCDKVRDNRHALNRQAYACDKVTEFFSRIIIQIVELHSAEGRMGILSRCAPKWVEVVVSSSLQSEEPWGDEFHRVSSTSCSSGMVGRLPSGGFNAIISGCMALMRQLLKEGIRMGSDKRSTHFLNLLNKQMRTGTNKQWNLTSNESVELQQCLVKVVRSMSDRPATPSPGPSTSLGDSSVNTVVSRASVPTLNQQQHNEAVAGPSRSGCQSVTVKEEPFSDKSFCHSFDDVLNIKKEPLQPMPFVSLACIKPDMDKFEELRLKLSDNQNLKNIDAIVKKQHGSPEDDEDDEPLDAKRIRLIKAQQDKPDSNGHLQKKSTKSRTTLKENRDSSIIVISDDDDDGKATTDANSFSDANIKRGSSSDTEDIVRDYNELSDSQVFEFETQEYVASAWNVPDSGIPEDINPDPVSKPHVNQPPHEASPSSSGTEFIPDEEIERACQQVEERMRPKEPAVSGSSSKTLETAEKSDVFAKPKPLSVKNQKPSHLPKKSLIIDALAHKIKPYSRKGPTTERVIASSEQPKSSPSTSSDLSSPYFSTSRRSPAVVPPKKIRKIAEPESTAERLGLKKKERKAFDLSQNSLDSVAQLRCHGQNVQVEPKAKKVCRTKTSPQKGTMKTNKKLLASQERQYFKQSRAKQVNQKHVNTTVQRRPSQSCDPKASNSLTVVGKHRDQQDDGFESKEPVCGSGNDRSMIAQGDLADSTISTEEKARQVVKKVTTDDVFGNEPMCHTQLELEDMEMCSQMERFGEENNAGIFLTQRDHVDMDLEEPETPKETNLPNDQMQIPDASVSERKCNDSNKDLFLKPGMSPMSLKRAKPSTTKIYTPSSRSASLALEMEKVVKPPTPSNVVKPKSPLPVAPPNVVKRQIPSTKAPPAVTVPLKPQQSLSKPFALPLSHAQKFLITLKNDTTTQPPTYQTYQRPEDPVRRTSTNVPNQCKKIDPLLLTQTILKWEYRFLENYKTFGTPDGLCRWPLKEVPASFAGYEDYVKTLYPLLLVNAFEEIANEWLKGGRVKLFLKLETIEYSNRTAHASFLAGLTAEEDSKQWYPKEDDLVLLWLPENTGAYSYNEPSVHDLLPHFGYVSRSNVSRSAGSTATLIVTIQTCGNVSSVNGQPVRCEVVGSMISVQREFRALLTLSNSPMLRPLLAPRVTHFAYSQEGSPDISTPEYNADQTRAISCGLNMIKETSAKSPKFMLIHGPPGTGKSKTIGGLLYKLLSLDGTRADPGRGLAADPRRRRVLLCAPSNAAIDCLMKKVILIFKDKCRNINAPRGNCGDINLVRLGSERTISKSLKHFSLDYQIAARAQRAQQPAEGNVQRRKEQLDQEINQLSQRCAKAQKDSSDFWVMTEKKKQLLKEREGLNRQIKESRGKRQESQAAVLQNAHVICCTLSTSGSSILENAFRRLGHEPFCCVIVDEASQAKETETLITTLYRCPAIILVGDPNQLPPTVVSQKAKDLGYDQSLMGRLCKSLYESKPQSFPIFLLRTQYRMHPQICQFPSKYIYNNALQNDSETTQRLRSNNWPFRPYRVFDVTDGRENKEKDSFANHKEVKLVLLLLRLLGEKSVRVGVITPYNAQKQRILQALSASDIEKHQKVDVDTVDGFQGREMDCVIVSCVRASGELGSIGFLGNRQRMNVTITRAKCSLFILGHLRTLREQSDWGALIQDAEARDAIVKTKEADFQSDARKIFKPVPTQNSLRSATSPDPSSSAPSHALPRMIPLDCPTDPQHVRDPRQHRRRVPLQRSRSHDPSHVIPGPSSASLHRR